MTDDNRQQLREMGFEPTEQNGGGWTYELWSREGRAHFFAYGDPTNDFIVYPRDTHTWRLKAQTFEEAIAAYAANLLTGGHTR